MTDKSNGVSKGTDLQPLHFTNKDTKDDIKTVKELFNNYCVSFNIPENASLIVLGKSAKDAYAAAFKNPNDQERFYCLLQRYLIFYETICKRFPEKKVLFKNEASTAVNALEEVRTSLKARYEERILQKEGALKKEDASNEGTPIAQNIEGKDVKIVKFKTITCQELESLIVQRIRVLVIDFREELDFQKRHIARKQCHQINIPGSFLEENPGVMPDTIDLHLDSVESSIWGKRTEFKPLVFCHWFEKPFEDGGRQYSILYHCLMGRSDKPLIVDPLVLEGGMYQFMDAFPALTSSSQQELAEEAAVAATAANIPNGAHPVPMQSQQIINSGPRIDRGSKPSSGRPLPPKPANLAAANGLNGFKDLSIEDINNKEMNPYPSLSDIGATHNRNLRTFSKPDEENLPGKPVIEHSDNPPQHLNGGIPSQGQDMESLKKTIEELTRKNEELMKLKEQSTEIPSKTELSLKEMNQIDPLAQTPEVGASEDIDAFRALNPKPKPDIPGASNQGTELAELRQKKPSDPKVQPPHISITEEEKLPTAPVVRTSLPVPGDRSTFGPKPSLPAPATPSPGTEMLIDRQSGVSDGVTPEMVTANSSVRPLSNREDKNFDGFQDDSGSSKFSSKSSRTLKRTNSTPDFTKIGLAPKGDEPITGLAKAPGVDRNNKPDILKLEKQRLESLNPRYARGTSGLCGLRNLGNTCYMNSVLQCLSHTSGLRDFFLGKRYLEEINTQNKDGTSGLVAKEFYLLLSTLWSGSYSMLSPVDFKAKIGRHGSQFLGTRQQDAQELLVSVLDVLHEDLNNVSEKKAVAVRDEEMEGKSDGALAELFWRNYTLNNNSIIVKLFQGQYRSIVECTVCRKRSVTFDTFMYLSLPIPAKSNRATLQQCFDLYCDPEVLEWNCPRCKTMRKAFKKLDIWKWPRYLIIHLKRFAFSAVSREKLQSTVTFPLDRLILDQSANKERAMPAMKLYGVVNHYGTLDQGHYIANAFSTIHSQWYKFDDESFDRISPEKITPNKQIWLSSPLSGPFRYDYSNHSWVYRRSGEKMVSLLDREFLELFQTESKFEEFEQKFFKENPI